MGHKPCRGDSVQAFHDLGIVVAQDLRVMHGDLRPWRLVLSHIAVIFI